ncbi:hypothetical protein GF420_10910 [candidate division GN15 bacterium]|nr:hypothetical protein [candidate division GN15 bacterium]
MPELPDVEVFGRYIDSTALNKKIAHVEISDADVLDRVSKRSLQQQLHGQRLQRTHRHGKNLFVAFAKDRLLRLHFGMTAFPSYYKDEADTPDYTRVRLEFTNGYSLAYSSKRKLGRVGIVRNLDEFIEREQLGPDPLSDQFDFELFRERLGSRRGSAKAALMNQAAIAGIGNVYSDEILYHCDIQPESNIARVIEQKGKRLYSVMNRVLDKTIEAGAEPERFPRSYLTRRREAGAACGRCSGTIRKHTVSGRSAYFCNKHQKRLS